MLFHAVNRLNGVREFAVDLTTCRKSRHPVAHQFAQRFPFQAHQFGDQQPRDHAAVAVSEIRVGAAKILSISAWVTRTVRLRRISSKIMYCGPAPGHAWLLHFTRHSAVTSRHFPLVSGSLRR